MAVKNDAWLIAQQAVDEVPPFLQDDDLTLERFIERNKGMLSKAEARNLLERLAQSDGPLEKQTRRKQGSKGGAVIIYITKK
jgi:hypothetical protein